MHGGFSMRIRHEPAMSALPPPCFSFQGVQDFFWRVVVSVSQCAAHPVSVCVRWCSDDDEKFHINVGIYGEYQPEVVRRPGFSPDQYNRDLEQLVHQLGGHKALYAHAYYSRYLTPFHCEIISPCIFLETV